MTAIKRGSWKLVRTRIPDLAQAKEGRKPRTKRVTSSRLHIALADKLKEESDEAFEAARAFLLYGKVESQEAETRANLVAELADVRQAFLDICDCFEVRPDQIEEVRLAKLQERGGLTDFKRKPAARYRYGIMMWCE